MTLNANTDAALSGETADAVPTTEAEIDELRKEIDRLDAEILAAVKRRTEVSRIIGRTRMASGGTRLVHSREMKVLERFSELGQEGPQGGGVRAAEQRANEFHIHRSFVRCPADTRTWRVRCRRGKRLSE